MKNETANETQCPVCNKVHGTKRTDELTDTAHTVLVSLIKHGNEPADVMFIMATIASSICASQPDGANNMIDDRIKTFNETFADMARGRYAVVTKLRNMFESIEAFIMQPTDGSVN